MSLATDDDQAFREHDHTHCIEDALMTAQAMCARKGARFTRLREQVFTIVWRSHQPIGAYAILEQLLADEPGQRRPAPPTVYRALDFLLEQGLVHRISSLNAYIGCTHPDSSHHNQFLICSCCSTTKELYSKLPEQFGAEAAADEFHVDRVLVEITGLCPNCASNIRGHAN